MSISHRFTPMCTASSPPSSRTIPKNVVNSLIVRYNNVEIFRADLGSGIAVNPYLQFYTTAEASGEFEFLWVDDAGVRGSERASLTVS